ncbi:hypothetical protein [Neobacillus niacini]
METEVESEEVTEAVVADEEVIEVGTEIVTEENAVVEIDLKN